MLRRTLECQSAFFFAGGVRDLLDDISELVIDAMVNVPLDADAAVWLQEHFLDAPGSGDDVSVDEVIYWLEESARIFGLLGM